MSKTNDCISVDEVAERLGVSKTKVQKWCLDGTLWYSIAVVDEKRNRTFRIPRKAFERHMAGELTPPAVYGDAVKEVLRFLKGCVVIHET